MRTSTQSSEFQKKKDFLVRKSRGKIVLPDYLQELHHLFSCWIDEDDLLPLEESDRLIESMGKAPYTRYQSSRITKTIDFSRKQTLRLLIDQAYKSYSGKLFVWTEYSRYCGMARVPSIRYFNVNFHFNDEHYGLINLISADLQNQIELDYYEENSRYFLKIEGVGQDWNSLKIDF